MTTCKFCEAWIGQCSNPCVDGSEYCSKHHGMKCVVTGEQATHSCPETFQFVCGAPLSDSAEHAPNGYAHRRKVIT